MKLGRREVSLWKQADTGSTGRSYWEAMFGRAKSGRPGRQPELWAMGLITKLNSRREVQTMHGLAPILWRKIETRQDDEGMFVAAVKIPESVEWKSLGLSWSL